MRAITQADIDVLMQSSREVFVKIQLLSAQGQVLDELQGDVIDGDVSIDAESDIRRTCNLDLYVKDRSLFVGEKRKVWLDKTVRLYYGIRHQRTQEILWYPLGIYLFNEQSYEYSAVTHTLSVSCADRMSRLTGLRSGQIGGVPTEIPAGSPIRSSMISAVTQLGGVRDYLIEDIGKEVPYDLSFPTGASVYDIVVKLRDLYPGWETFFDLDGTFVCQPIPTLEDDPILYDGTLLRPLVISEMLTNSFSAVKNVSEVWGKSIDAGRYADTSTYTGNCYRIALDSFALEEYMTVGFKASAANAAAPRLQINALAACPIVDDEGIPLGAGIMLAGKSYVVKYRRGQFVFLGQFQIHAIAKEVSAMPSAAEITRDKAENLCDNISYVVNPESPYTVEKLGEIRQVFSGGEYEDIYADSLCVQRAEYENWKSTRLQDGVTLEMMGIPWMDVNQKLRYMASSTGAAAQYITKSISLSLRSGRQTVQCIRFYPLYPWIVSR